MSNYNKMPKCVVCRKVKERGGDTFFHIPKDVDRRRKWSEACRTQFSASSQICRDHFLPSHIITAGRKNMLMPHAVPFVNDFQKASSAKTCEQNSNKTRKNINAVTPYQPEPINYELQKHPFGKNSNNSAQPLFQTSPILQIPLFKSESSTTATQTNTRFCGTIEVSEFADEYRINCFYCCETFPFEKWKKFKSHLKKKHTDYEEAFNAPKYVSDDHDYTPIGSSSCSTLTECNPAIVQTLVIEANALLSYLVESLESTESTRNQTVPVPSNSEKNLVLTNYSEKLNNVVKSESRSVIDQTVGTKRNSNDSTLPKFSKNDKSKATKNRSVKISSKNGRRNTRKSKQTVPSSGILFLSNAKQQTSNKTALSRCLKRSNTIDTIDPIEIKQEYEPSAIEHVQQNNTELSYEFTPRDIIDFLLDNMKNYPVLWEFDGKPFNENYYEANEELCRLVNGKWSMNIDNLRMRRSVNRVLRYYCSVYPLENVENIDKFTSYYDKCAAFLPKSVNDVAYARCSHCYKCYPNDFELKGHLLEELKHLQWPFKCVQCKECFRDINEYEFHKHLPHYTEVFRCEPCNKRYTRRNKYNRHVFLDQIKHSNEPGKYACKICGKSFNASSNLRAHSIFHGEKKHKCHLCPKSYFTNVTLKHHLKTHIDGYDFMCEVCGKGFNQPNNLREHMKMHTGAKVTCNICNLRLRKSSLMRHLRTVHVACEGTIDSTYRARCHKYKALLRPSKKRYSYRNKYKEKTYCCKICNIRFDGYKSILEHNKEFHSDFPKLPCKICSSAFKQKLSLNRHYRQKHTLHSYQVYQLVEKDEDVNTVLAIKTEELDKLTETLSYSLIGQNSTPLETKHTTIIKTDPSPDEIFIEEEKLHCDTIQDQIMKVADNIAPHDIKLDDDNYMNDFFTNLLK